VVTVTVHLLTRRAARVMNCGMARMARLVVPVVTVTVHLLTRRAARVMNCGMARMARLVVPGIPHHVTQRGNGRAPTFFSEGDYRLYLDLLAEHCAGAGVEVWAWVLMPNHTHLVLTPSDEDGLRAALSRTHRRYADTFTRERSDRDTSGRGGSAAWPWTKRIWRRQSATWRSTRCARGWSSTPATGDGRASTPIWGWWRTMALRRPRRCSSASAARQSG
jgi:REP element-mobilizing transposase RayT